MSGGSAHHGRAPSGWRLLVYLASKFDSIRILVLVSYRPAELTLGGHPFLKVRADLQARGLCREIPLTFLSRDELGRYLDLNELDAALEVFERLASLVPAASQVHYNLSMIHRRRGERETAERETERFRELKANEDEEWNRQNELHRKRLRADEALESGDVSEAERLGRELVASGDPQAEDFLLLGRALDQEGKHAEAERVLQEGLARDPYDREALEASLAAAEASEDETASELYRRRLALLRPTCSPSVP